MRDGYGIVPGFVHFLSALRDVDVYAGTPMGAEGADDFEMQGFQLIRVPVHVNAVDSAAIVDSGAVYTIVTQSFAREVRVRMIPDSRASGRGLHKKEFPVDFGIIGELSFGGLTLRDVPVMVMPDEAMLFETTRGRFPVPIVLGFHLLKEFRAEIDYAGRRIDSGCAGLPGRQARRRAESLRAERAACSPAARSTGTASTSSSSTPAASRRS